MADGPRKDILTKKFSSINSLLYEKHRLETFIEWPIPWVSPRELAAAGFFYSGTSDRCVCIFCGKIFENWEMGDIPIREHQRQQSNCPLFQRQSYTANIPLDHSAILDLMPGEGEDFPVPLPSDYPYFLHIDKLTLTEAYKEEEEEGEEEGEEDDIESKTPPPFERDEQIEKKESSNANDANDDIFKRMGLRSFVGPKSEYKYKTVQDRIKSFYTDNQSQNIYKKWPDRVNQKPKELAEAGLFYLGISDYTRCFYCHGGLCNWEVDDDPWEEHARWYPDCYFINCIKGKDFIEKVWREKPPLVRSIAVKNSKARIVGKRSSKKNFRPISDKDLDVLMKYNIIETAKESIDDPQSTIYIKQALREKLNRTGIPFLNLNKCLDATFHYKSQWELEKNNLLMSRVCNYNNNNAHLDISNEDIDNDLPLSLPSPSPLHPSQSSSSSIIDNNTYLHITDDDVYPPLFIHPPPPNPFISPFSCFIESLRNEAGIGRNRRRYGNENNDNEDELLEIINRMVTVNNENDTIEFVANNELSETGNMIMMMTMIFPSSINDDADDTTNNDNINNDEGIDTNNELLDVQTRYVSSQSPLLPPVSSDSPPTRIDNNSNNNNDYYNNNSNNNPPLHINRYHQPISSSSISTTATTGEFLQSNLEDAIDMANIEKINIGEKYKCKICMDSDIEIVFLPCNHMCCCGKCFMSMEKNECPICRIKIEYAINPILP